MFPGGNCDGGTWHDEQRTIKITFIPYPLTDIVKAMVFPVVMYGHDSWTIKKDEC